MDRRKCFSSLEQERGCSLCLDFQFSSFDGWCCCFAMQAANVINVGEGSSPDIRNSLSGFLLMEKREVKVTLWLRYANIVSYSEKTQKLHDEANSYSQEQEFHNEQEKVLSLSYFRSPTHHHFHHSRRIFLAQNSCVCLGSCKSISCWSGRGEREVGEGETLL